MPAKDLLPWGIPPCPQHKPDAEWEARDRLRASCLAWWVYFYGVRMMHSGQHLWSQFTPPVVCHAVLLTTHSEIVCWVQDPGLLPGVQWLRSSCPGWALSLMGETDHFCAGCWMLWEGSIRKTSGLTRGGKSQGRLLGGVNMAAEPWRTIDEE